AADLKTTCGSAPIWLSPELTSTLDFPPATAAFRSRSSTTARRAIPPASAPLPAAVAVGKSSRSGLNAKRCECSSDVQSTTTCLSVGPMPELELAPVAAAPGDSSPQPPTQGMKTKMHEREKRSARRFMGYILIFYDHQYDSLKRSTSEARRGFTRRRFSSPS